MQQRKPMRIMTVFRRAQADLVALHLAGIGADGVADADVVYEIMNSTLNDRITRFMVVVKDWDKIEQLGSIRSARPTNFMLAAEWNAVLCHDGGPFFITSAAALPVTATVRQQSSPSISLTISTPIPRRARPMMV